MNDKKDEEEDRNLTNDDLGLDSNTEAALPELTREAEKTVEAAVTTDNIGQPTTIDDSNNAVALPRLAESVRLITGALPAEYAQELSQLQSQAPPMGPAFVRRRMMAELGPAWAARFRSFQPQPAASASLGQVHQAIGHDGEALAAKLQYPDMQSAVEADLTQLKMVFALHARMNPAVETGEILKEISARIFLIRIRSGKTPTVCSYWLT